MDWLGDLWLLLVLIGVLSIFVTIYLLRKHKLGNENKVYRSASYKSSPKCSRCGCNDIVPEHSSLCDDCLDDDYREAYYR